MKTVWGSAKPPLIGATLFAMTNNPYWLRIQIRQFRLRRISVAGVSSRLAGSHCPPHVVRF